MSCRNATRPHRHVGGCSTQMGPKRQCDKPLIVVYGYGDSWQITIHDDGSICDHVVTPTPAQYAPERVLDFMLAEDSELRTRGQETTKRKRRAKRSRAGGELNYV